MFKKIQEEENCDKCGNNIKHAIYDYFCDNCEKPMGKDGEGQWLNVTLHYKDKENEFQSRTQEYIFDSWWCFIEWLECNKAKLLDPEVEFVSLPFVTDIRQFLASINILSEAS